MQSPIWSQFHQTVYNQVLNASYSNRLSRLKARVFGTLFNRIKKHDPLIKYDFSNVTLLLPFSHQLPFILKNYPYYSSNLARIAKYVKQKYDNLHLIDVGANVGDTAALLRGEVFFPILCIEGDEQFLAALKKNVELFAEVDISASFLGENTATIPATVDKKAGTARLQETTSDAMLAVKTLPDVLKEHPRFANAKMLKIDTDGFDCKIIRGAIEYVQQTKPVIFFEYDPFFMAQQGDDGLSIFKLLSEAGYQKLIIYDNFGDLLLSCNVDDFDLLHHIHLFFSGRLGRYYCDICAFHGEDCDLFQQTKSLETRFLEEIRGIN